MEVASIANPRLRVRFVAVLFLVAALRDEWGFQFPTAAALDLAMESLAPALPDLNTAGRAELAILPGIGPARALSLVRKRPYLGVDLSPATLPLLPGFGEKTALLLQAWYAAEGRQRAPLEWVDDSDGFPLQVAPNHPRNSP